MVSGGFGDNVISYLLVVCGRGGAERLVGKCWRFFRFWGWIRMGFCGGSMIILFLSFVGCKMNIG